MHLHADYSIKMGYIACVYWEYLLFYKNLFILVLEVDFIAFLTRQFP